MCNSVCNGVTNAVRTRVCNAFRTTPRPDPLVVCSLYGYDCMHRRLADARDADACMPEAAR